jgi:hypothetical protein
MVELELAAWAPGWVFMAVKAYEVPTCMCPCKALGRLASSVFGQTVSPCSIFSQPSCTVCLFALATSGPHPPPCLLINFGQLAAPGWPQVVSLLQQDAAIALVSDAGMPCINDPGAQLVAAAAEQGLPVIPIPGPSSVLTALVGSGLSTTRFTFCGYTPPKAAARRKLFAELQGVRPRLALLCCMPCDCGGRVAHMHACMHVWTCGPWHRYARLTLTVAAGWLQTSFLLQACMSAVDDCSEGVQNWAE